MYRSSAALRGESSSSHRTETCGSQLGGDSLQGWGPVLPDAARALSRWLLCGVVPPVAKGSVQAPTGSSRLRPSSRGVGLVLSAPTTSGSVAREATAGQALRHGGGGGRRNPRLVGGAWDLLCPAALRPQGSARCCLSHPCSHLLPAVTAEWAICSRVVGSAET